MLTKRIIPCLDVRDGKVVKGVRFRDLKAAGDIVQLAQLYSMDGADELVFYDISASSEHRTVDKRWVRQIAQVIKIPFCVAGGIRTLQDAAVILNAGADKISINSAAIRNPELVEQLASEFGQQCVVIGIDSDSQNGAYQVFQYSALEKTVKSTSLLTKDWIREVQSRGAGEIVLNCINCDGVKNGYDIEQLKIMRAITTIPLIASGGAGSKQDFLDMFCEADVDGALAASVFHSGEINMQALKKYLKSNNIEVRL